MGFIAISWVSDQAPDLACLRPNSELCILDLNPYEKIKREKWGKSMSYTDCCEAKVNRCVRIQFVNYIKLYKVWGTLMLQFSNIFLRVSFYPSCIAF